MPKYKFSFSRLFKYAFYGVPAVLFGLFLMTNLSKAQIPAVSMSKPSAVKSEVTVLDKVSSLQIAGNIAIMTNLDTQSEVINNYTLLATQESLTIKPTVLPAAPEERIKRYTVLQGDTPLSIANKFGVTENSVIWSNQSIDADFVPGAAIMVPATTGIVYTVRPGETAAFLANRFKTDIDQIKIYNDAEVDDLKPNQQIVIPNGVLPPTERPKSRQLFSSIGEPVIAPTAKIKAGDIIGFVGDTGYSFGAHLHLEARVNGAIMDPNPYIDSGTWRRPVGGPVSQTFNNPSSLYDNGFHSGIDFAPGEGAPIKAVADGVLYRGCASAVLGAKYGNGLGYMAVLNHGNGLQSIYAHMVAGPDGFACRN